MRTGDLETFSGAPAATKSIVAHKFIQIMWFKPVMEI